jgi:hypothetical protein
MAMVLFQGLGPPLAFLAVPLSMVSIAIAIYRPQSTA